MEVVFKRTAFLSAATTVSTFDMYEHPEQELMEDRPEMRQTKYSETVVESSRSAERSLSLISSASTGKRTLMKVMIGFSFVTLIQMCCLTQTYSFSVISSCSLKDAEPVGTSLNIQLDLEFIRMSEKFQYSLLLIERSILRNIFQSQLSLYRKLPRLEGNLSLFIQGYMNTM